MNLLEIKNIVFGYDKHEIIRGVSFSVQEGDFLGIVGPNGVGKSTLLRLLFKMHQPWQGNIFYQDKNLKNISLGELSRQAAMIPQIMDTSFPFTVEEFVFMGRYPHLGRFQKPGAIDYQIVEEALSAADVAHLKTRRFFTLSGGERRRVIFAQGIAQTPRLLLLDEPTSHLDITHQVQILDLVKKLNRTWQVTVIVVLHDLNLAAAYCRRLILLNQGRIFRQGRPREVLTYQNIEAVYKTVVVVKENPVNGKPYVFLSPGEEARAPLPGANGVSGETVSK